MLSRLTLALTLGFGFSLTASAQYWNDFELAPHNYKSKELKDPMTRLLSRVESGELKLDEAAGKPLVDRLLKELEIPASSQVLVFTQTSLQRKIVNPGNPRAMYFNEDVYLGWMPGGRIEFDLSDFYPADAHLAEGSDVLAMLAHDHQISAHCKVRQALFDNELALDSGREVLAEMKQSSRIEVNDGIRHLLRYLTFADEPPLGGKQVQGGDAYRKDFLANQRKTAGGLSLKDLDLKNRLLRHRVSWMIYSRAFDGMPRAAKEEFYHRLWEILTAKTAPEGFEHLQPAEKVALIEILGETVEGLPASWKAGS